MRGTLISVARRESFRTCSSSSSAMRRPASASSSLFRTNRANAPNRPLALGKHQTQLESENLRVRGRHGWGAGTRRAHIDRVASSARSITGSALNCQNGATHGSGCVDHSITVPMDHELRAQSPRWRPNRPKSASRLRSRAPVPVWSPCRQSTRRTWKKRGEHHPLHRILPAPFRFVVQVDEDALVFHLLCAQRKKRLVRKRAVACDPVVRLNGLNCFQWTHPIPSLRCPCEPWRKSESRRRTWLAG